VSGISERPVQRCFRGICAWSKRTKFRPCPSAKDSVVLRFNFQRLEVFTFCRHAFAEHSTYCHQSPLACTIAGSWAYAYFLDTVVGKSELVYMLKGRGVRTDHCRTSFLRRRDLLRLLLPLERVKLRLPTNSMIMRNKCLSGSNHSNLEVRLRCHTVLQAAVRSTNTTPAFLAEDLSAMFCMLHQQDDLMYGRPPVSKAHLYLRE